MQWKQAKPILVRISEWNIDSSIKTAIALGLKEDEKGHKSYLRP
jgi:hypothetical protein